jgi:hypothetical protein
MSRIDDLVAKFDEIDLGEYVEFFESRKIGDDVVVHSRFKADDLRLLCRAFAGYGKSGYAGSDVGECKKLFKRMVRKVK